VLTDRRGAPLSLVLSAANRTDMKLAEATLDGLVVERVGSAPTVLVGVGAVHGFTLSRMRLVGNQDGFPDAYCHGIKLSEAGTVSGVHLADSSVTGMRYGLLQTNSSTAVVTDVRVQQCTFEKNQNTDLEFNSPRGLTRQVDIESCRFADNDSPGFAIGLAHVEDAVVRANAFDSYALEAVHIEDYSVNVAVSDNEFVDCGLRDHSFVQVIGRSRDVRISGNTSRARRNTNPIYVVNALAGGNDTTPGGRSRAHRATSSCATTPSSAWRPSSRCTSRASRAARSRPTPSTEPLLPAPATPSGCSRTRGRRCRRTRSTGPCTERS